MYVLSTNGEMCVTHCKANKSVRDSSGVTGRKIFFAGPSLRLILTMGNPEPDVAHVDPACRPMKTQR